MSRTWNYEPESAKTSFKSENSEKSGNFAGGTEKDLLGCDFLPETSGEERIILVVT